MLSKTQNNHGKQVALYFIEHKENLFTSHLSIYNLSNKYYYPISFIRFFVNNMVILKAIILTNSGIFL